MVASCREAVLRTIISSVLALLLASPAFAMDDQALYWRVDGMAEHRFHDREPATEWKSDAWLGGDTNKLRLQNSGVLSDNGTIDGEGGTKGVDSRAYYSRLISEFWDAKAGLQFTAFDRGQHRAGLLAGFEGRAPQDFRIDAVAGVSETGVVSLRLDVDRDIPIMQKLIAAPYLETMLASADDPAIRLGAGLSRLELGLRLRYEFAKEFAPYLGVSFEQFTGNTATYLASDNGLTSKLRVLVGLKCWF